MEALETFRLEQNHQDKCAEFHLLKSSIERQLTEARNEESELRKSIDELIESGGVRITQQTQLQESLNAYKWLGVSIKSFEDNLQVQFSPAFRGQLPVEHYVLVVELGRDDWGVLQHSLPPHIPTEKLRKESGGDLKTFIALLADHVYAFVQRREAVQLVKKRYSGYLSRDIEVDLPVSYIGLQLLLQPAQGATKMVEITLQYDINKVRPERVDIKLLKADVGEKKIATWRQWLLNSELDDGLEKIIEDCG